MHYGEPTLEGSACIYDMKAVRVQRYTLEHGLAKSAVYYAVDFWYLAHGAQIAIFVVNCLKIFT